MTKQEQIKEMAKVIATTKICDALALSECIKKKCDKKREYGCSAYSQAEALYDAGYRKQSDTVKEFAKRAKSRATYHPLNLKSATVEQFIEFINKHEEELKL